MYQIHLLLPVVLYYSQHLFLSLSLSLSLPLPYTRPKVQAHHLLIRQKECNEIINVLELIMNMIKKAKISGAEISLPIQSQGLLSFRKRQKKPSTRPGSNSPLCPCMELLFTPLLCPWFIPAPSCWSQMRCATACTPRGPDLPSQIAAPRWR